MATGPLPGESAKRRTARVKRAAAFLRLARGVTERASVTDTQCQRCGRHSHPHSFLADAPEAYRDGNF